MTQSKTNFSQFSTATKTTSRAQSTQRTNLIWRMASCGLSTTQTEASHFPKSTGSSCFLLDLIGKAILMQARITSNSLPSRTIILRSKSGKVHSSSKELTLPNTTTLLPKEVSWATLLVGNDKKTRLSQVKSFPLWSKDPIETSARIWTTQKRLKSQLSRTHNCRIQKIWKQKARKW